MEYRYNYKTIEISEEDLKYTLSSIADIILQSGEFNYKKLVNEESRKKSPKLDEASSPRGISFDKNTPREMYETCIMVDGSKYKGQFLKGGTIKDGIGQMIYPDGSLFEGIFRNDDTIKGRYISTNGTVYKGEMKNHKMHGKGILRYGKKIIYKGKFENGERCNKKKALPTTIDGFLNFEDDEPSGQVKSVQWDLDKY